MSVFAEAAPMTAAPPAPEGIAGLFQHDPDLARHVARSELGAVSRLIGAPVVDIARGRFEPADVLSAGRNAFLAIVLSGLVAREVGVENQPALQLLGPGDGLGGGELQVDLVPTEQVWSALARTRVALIDDGFLRAARHRPRLMTGVVERLLERHDYTMVQLAIAQHPRVEDRLMLLFQMLAGRWGRVATDGVHVNIAVTHEALGRLIGARRPTVSLALKALTARGRIARRPDGSWVVAAAGPAEKHATCFLTEGTRPRLTS